jgi:hypothetical protein
LSVRVVRTARAAPSTGLETGKLVQKQKPGVGATGWSRDP